MDREQLDKLIEEYDELLKKDDYKKVISSCKEHIKSNPNEADLFYCMPIGIHYSAL